MSLTAKKQRVPLRMPELNEFTVYPHRSLSVEEVRRLVDRALAGGGLMDDLLTRALYPNGVPQMWGEWSEEARWTWQQGVALYISLRDDAVRSATFTVADAWRVLAESAAGKEPLVWKDIAGRLGVPATVAQRKLCESMGFTISGRYGERRVTRGPCIQCGRRWGVGLLKNGWCIGCREKVD